MSAERWDETVVRVLKANDVRLVAYVPDKVLVPLIERVAGDPWFTVFAPAREEEAVGIVAGAYMAGLRGIVLMQTSGFATLPNVLASLTVPSQIPLLMLISERGTIGDHQLGQAIVCRTMRPVLQTLGIEHHAIERQEDVEFVCDRMIRQAFSTQAAAAMILSPLLTGRDAARAATGANPSGAVAANAASSRSPGAGRAVAGVAAGAPFDGPARSGAAVLNRSALTRRLVARLGRDEAVIGGIGHTHFDLWAAGQRPQNFYMLGSMGLAVPIALGVALAQPARGVFALEGDGSMLMQLGALATVAAQAPRRLAIVVWDNGAYQITGSQPTLTGAGADLVAIARGAGISRASWAADDAHFDALIDAALDGQGPVFIAARTDRSPPAGVTERDAAKIRLGFMAGIADDRAVPR